MRRFSLLLLVLVSAAANAAVTGTVVGTDGAPIAGARVRVFAREPFSAIAARLLSATPDPAPLATAQSAADGRFSIDVKGNAAVDLVVDAADRDPAALYAADGDDAGAVVLRPADKARRVKVTAGGKPLPSALVYLGHSLLVRTDAEGTFAGAFTGETPFVIHPDHGAGVIAERNGEVEFPRGTAVRGRVVARDGKTPVAGATISAGGWPLARSGGDGAFSIAHAPARLRALVAVSGSDAGAALLDGAKPVEIRLGTAAALSGTVTAKGGAPVAGATVTLTHNGEIYSAVSDAKGNYAIAAVPAATYDAQAFHPAYVNASVPTMRVAPSATHAFVLPPRSRIRGTVVDEDKKPVAGAFVGTPFLPANNIVMTTPAGEFSLRVIPLGQTFILASKNGYATTASAPLTIEAGETKSGVALTLRRGFPLQVKVVDAGKQPVANANVDLLTALDSRGVGRSAPLPCSVADRVKCRTTGPDGTLETRIGEGKYDVYLSGDFVAKVLREQALTARSSPFVVTVERGADVAGRVIFGDGTPVADARVSPMNGGPAAAVTDANGAFTLKQLPRLATSIVAATTDDMPVRSVPVKVTPPARDVTITIPTPARIEGRVIDRATSQPVTSFTVTAVQRGTGGGNRGVDVTSDDGAFSLKRVQPGALDVRVTAAGYVNGVVSDLVVEEGKALTGVEVKLDRGGRVVGHVNAAGSSAAGVRVRGTTRSNRMPPVTNTDANGDYTLDNVPPGDVTIDFAKDGFVTKRKSVEVAAGKDARVDVDLDRGREVHGRVADKSGQPIAGARVAAATTTAPFAASATSDSDGQFTISGLEDGHYRISAQKNGYVSTSIEDVDPAAAQPLTLTLDRGATLNGRVVGLPAEELGQVRVSASGRNSGSSAQTDAGGNFTLTGLPDGTVNVIAYRQGMPMRQSPPKTVEVMNGNAPTVEIDFSAGITIRGRVTRNGVAVSGGNVMFVPKERGAPYRLAQGMIAADGTYEVSGAEPGDYDVRVNTMGAYNDAMPYTVVSNAVFDIDLKGASVHGVALDAATGAPLPDVRVYATPTTPGLRAGRNAVSDSDGRFTLDTLPDGGFMVRGDREHYATASQAITVSGGAAQPVELRLTRGSDLAVRIVDADNGTAIDGTVTLVDDQKHYLTTGSGRGDDGATHVWAAPGRYTANVHASGYMMESVGVTVPGPEVRVALTRTAALVITSRSGGMFRLASPMMPPSGVGGVIRDVGRVISVRPGERVPLNSLRPGAMEVDKVSADGKTVLRAYTVTLVAGQTVTLDAD